MADPPRASAFVPCPRLDAPTTSPSLFWTSFGAAPRPILLSSPPASSDDEDFVRAFGTAEARGTAFDDVGIIGPESPYKLSNPGYTPGIFERAQFETRYPLPPSLSTVMQRPVVSIGLNRTGERDIAHHYHPVTAMRLLQGEKIWALRPPGDEDCMFNRGTCTDPFDVCAYYASASAPAPACVQRAGDTILVPDGWYHGTCNNASITVGWGGQGRLWPLDPPACRHCNARDHRGQALYATTAEPLLMERDASELVRLLGARHELRHVPMHADGVGRSFQHLGWGSQSPLMAIRSLVGQFVVQTALASETNRALRDPDCRLVSPAARAAEFDGATMGWLRSSGHLHLYIHLRGEAATLRLRHRASGETEARRVEERHAAIWLAGGLERIDARGGAATLAIVCRAPWPSEQERTEGLRQRR